MSGLVPIVATWNARLLVDALQNSLNWFHFLFLKGGLLIILITEFFCHHSFFTQLDSEIICL